MKKGWGKLGFAKYLPWENSDFTDRVVFGSAAHQLGDVFAMRMWKHMQIIATVYDEIPDDDDAEAVIIDYMRTLESRDATELLAFYRTSRAAGLAMTSKHGGSAATSVNPRARCATHGLLPFSEPIYPGHDDDDLPF